MTKFFTLSFFLTLFVSSPLYCTITPIHWGTDEWPGVTSANGTGMYHELIREIYPAQKYQLNVSYYPWQRVIQNLDEAFIDMTGGLPERHQYYQSAQPVLSQRIVLMIAKEKADSFDVDNLQNYRGSWRKGYKQDIVHHVLKPPVVGTYVNRAKQALNFIASNKVDYYVDIEDVTHRELKPNSTAFKLIQVGYFNLYWSFPQTDKGMELKHQFDQKWSKLMANGFIKKLYNRYGASVPQQRKRLVCGLSDGYPPYQFKDRHMGATGFDADVFKELLKTTRQESELMQANWGDLVPTLLYGNEVDCVLGMEITETRKAMFDFSTPYYQRTTAVFTLATNNELNNLEDLIGKKVTGDKQSTFEDMLKTQGLYEQIHLKYTQSKEESFRLLKSGKYVAMVAPKEVGLYLAKKHNAKVKIMYEMKQSTPVAIAVKKGNINLIGMFNALIHKAQVEKRIDKLYLHWFGQPLHKQ